MVLDFFVYANLTKEGALNALLSFEVLFIILTLQASIKTAADNKICDIFPNFRKNKV